MAENASYKKRSYLKGRLKAPGDKSITHRSLVFSTLIKGRRQISNALLSHDIGSTIDCLRALGLTIERSEHSLFVESSGQMLHHVLGRGPSEEFRALMSAQNIEMPCGNSGTTMRILSGLAAAIPGATVHFNGDQSLSGRDMQRVLDPLQSMGARVEYLQRSGHAPFKISGERLHGGHFALPVSSAQVSTAIILAGLLGQGETIVSTPYMVRDHSLRALQYLGAPVLSVVDSLPQTVTVEPLTENLEPLPVQVAGDISSAAFILVAAAILPGSQVEITDVGLNPGRRLVLDVLQEMGACLELLNERTVCGEPVGDIRLEGPDRLKPCHIKAERVASGIDEIPILALACAFADGESCMEGVGELAAKESDRLSAMVQNLRGLGIEAFAKGDSLKISGGKSLSDIALAFVSSKSHSNFRWKSFNDHRIAMAGHIAALALGPSGSLEVDDSSSIAVSYPGFFQDIDSLLLGGKQ